MSIKEREHLINSQLKLVKEAILIDEVIDGDGSEVYVEFKGRSSRFIVNAELGNSINRWIDNLQVITINEIEQIMKKYNVSLKKIAELLEDVELMEISNIYDWVKKYNNQDYFLDRDTIDRIVKGNL